MPIFTNPDVQQFVEQQTGLNPVEAVRSHLPAKFTEGVGEAVYPRGTPIGMQAGQALYDSLEHKQFLKPFGDYMSTFGTNNGRAAALTALALGLGGAGFGAMTGRNPVAWGLAGAGAGALGGYGASALTGSLARRRNQRAQSAMSYADWDKQRMERQREEQLPKQAAYYGMGDENPMTYIQSRVFADQAMVTGEKMHLLSTVQDLPEHQLSALASILRSVVGAGVGYVIAKFLLNTGSLGQSLGAAAGGLFGAMSGSSLPTNSFGEQSDPDNDVFGRRRFVI